MPETSSINELINDLVADDEVDRSRDPRAARRKAMDLLARREHSKHELLEKLQKAGFDENTALDAIEELKDEGLQSDRRFVEAFVQSRVRQGKGPMRIRADLSQRGVRDPVIHEALSEADADWSLLAIDVRRKKFGDDKPVDLKDKARQMRFLQYRGFESDQVRAAVDGSGAD